MAIGMVDSSVSSETCENGTIHKKFLVMFYVMRLLQLGCI
jgi:hypothetical protein